MHKPNRPTTCDISDIINEVADFVTANPTWMEEEDSIRRMAMAYSILGGMSSPDMVTDEEYDFIMDIQTIIKERTAS